MKKENIHNYNKGDSILNNISYNEAHMIAYLDNGLQTMGVELWRVESFEI